MTVLRRFSIVLATLFVVLILVSGCTKPGKRPIIQVGDWTMDVDMFREILRSSFGTGDMSKITQEQIDQKIHDLVAQRLVTGEARKLSLDTLDYARTLYNQELDSRAMKALHSQVVIDKVITDKMLKDFYQKDKYEVRVFHILIRDGETRSDEAAKQLADSLYQVAIQPGTNFIELAKKYNEDKSTPAGDIGWFGYGVMVPEFQDKVWNMQINEISEPVRTVYGWHIIKLVNRREKLNRPPFDLAKNQIRSSLLQMHGKEVFDRSLAFIDSLKKSYNVQVNQEAVDKMVAKIAKTADILRVPDPFRKFTPDELSQVLVTFDLPPGTLSVKDVSDYINQYVRPSDRVLTDKTVDRQLDVIISQIYLMPAEVKKRGLKEEPEVVDGAREAVDYYLFNYLKNQRREHLASPTVDEMKAYYDSHTNLYMTPKQYEGIEILLDQAVLARRVRRMVDRGQSMEALADKYTVRANGKKNHGHLGPFPEGTFGALSDVLAKAKVGDIVGPVDIGDGFSIFKLTKIYEPQLQPFDTVRPKIVKAIKEENAAGDYTAWTDSLMQVDPYKVYRNNLKYVLEDK